MDSRRLALLEAMGIEYWRDRRTAAPAGGVGPGEAQAAATGVCATPLSAAASVVTATASVPSAPRPEDADRVAALDWGALEAAVAGCQRCTLASCRTQTVFGVGRRDARWMVIGEAPGAEEDRQGEPFVGRAGQLLNAMLSAIGLARSEVFIANILKCRPPENRDPRPEESLACRPYLDRQIALVAPALILCVGRIAAQTLLDTTTPVGKLRGRTQTYGTTGIPVVVTYHPAYLLRSPREKRRAWEDLLYARRVAAAADA